MSRRAGPAVSAPELAVRRPVTIAMATLAVAVFGFLSAREPDLEKLVRGRLRRGTVTCYVRVNLLAAEDVIRVRPEVVEGLEHALAPLRKGGGGRKWHSHGERDGNRDKEEGEQRAVHKGHVGTARASDEHKDFVHGEPPAQAACFGLP